MALGRIAAVAGSLKDEAKTQLSAHDAAHSTRKRCERYPDALAPACQPPRPPSRVMSDRFSVVRSSGRGPDECWPCWVDPVGAQG